MFIYFFKTNRPVLFFSLIVFLLFFWSFALFTEYKVDVLTSFMPFYEWLAMATFSVKLIQLLFALLLIVLQAKLLNDIVADNEILSKRCFLPALFYIMLVSGFPSWLSLHPVLFANLFLLLTLKFLFSTYHKENILYELFDSGMLVSIASLFYFPSIVFLLLIWTVLIVFRPFQWREWVIACIGVIVPYLFVLTFYFWFEQFDNFWQDRIAAPILNKTLVWSFPVSFYVLVVFLFFITLLSFNSLLKGLSVNKLRTKKNIIIMIWYFIFSLMSFALAPESGLYHFVLLSIPLAVYFANYFLMVTDRWLSEIIFMLLLSAIIVNHFFHIYNF